MFIVLMFFLRILIWSCVFFMLIYFYYVIGVDDVSLGFLIRCVSNCIVIDIDIKYIDVRIVDIYLL